MLNWPEDPIFFKMFCKKKCQPMADGQEGTGTLPWVFHINKAITRMDVQYQYSILGQANRMSRQSVS